MRGLRSGKSTLSRFSMILLSGLGGGHFIFPYLLITALAVKNTGYVRFFAPVVLVYAVPRACLMALRGLGEITNPYRILKGGVLFSVLGVLMLIFSPLCKPLQNVGIICFATGLAPFEAMFTSLKGFITGRQPELKKCSGPAALFTLTLAILILLVVGKVPDIAVGLVVLLYLVAAYYILAGHDWDDFFENRPAFDYKKKQPVYFLFGLLMLISLIVLRQYSNSRTDALFHIVPLCLLPALFLEGRRYRVKRPGTVFRTYWAGGMRNFLILFPLLYFAAYGGRVSVFGKLAIIIGFFAPAFVAKPLKKLLPREGFADACMLLSSALAFLLLVPSAPVNIVATVLCMGVSGLVSSSCAAEYMRDERHALLDRPLARERVHIAGGTIHQTVFLSALFLLGKYMAHRDLLAVDETAAKVFSVIKALRIAGGVSVSLLLIFAVIIVLYEKKRKQSA